MKIHIAHYGRSPTSWTHQYDALHDLARRASPRLHEVTAHPEQADHIFLTNAEQPDGDLATEHPLLRQHPEKCLLLSERWRPPFLLAGIYANAPRHPFGRGRFRSGSYLLHHPDFQHPLVQRHTPADDLPPSQRDILFSFLGRDCHPIRLQLFRQKFRRADILVQDTSDFNAFSHDPAGKAAAQQNYYNISRRSRFILCPRGCGCSSIRLFEALHMGIAPIIVSDDWIPCEGPDWASFAIFVRETDLPRLEEIAVAAEPRFIELGRLARAAHEAFFAPERYFNFLVANANSIRAQRRIPERWFVRLLPLRQQSLRIQHAIRRRLS